ncbi:hypothetical protein [Fimbriimonas ginsengisoli]|uniref:Uncharacterized protein n=1 Tax=Fimbriimonas ginsengisoli Gsoil 348 TaxID=661478 RepID=A0A068NXU8_FIMGI|nr:hypothetical protein [Fimbriimonas ginsengisoli]AIE86474.1 hypothetical protein OP10G_3106 [Fimbriimonas ginsengisoli Gsoil 348]
MTAFAPLLAFALLGSAQQTSSFFQRLVPHPTGQNGYEEYLRAADRVNDGVVEMYLDGVGAPLPDLSPVDRRRWESLAAELGSLDYLAVQQAAVRRYGAALDIAAQGNGKPCYDPRDPRQTVKFPEYRVLRQVVRLFVSKSYVQSATGDRAGGLQSLLSALTLSRRMGGVTVLGQLYGILASGSVYERLAEELPRLSLSDLLTLQSYTGSALAEPTAVEGVLRANAAQRDDAIQNLDLQRGKGLLSETDKGTQDIRDRLAAASPAELESFRRALQDLNRKGFEQSLADIHRPEKEWYDATKRWHTAGNRGRLGSASTMEDVADAVYRETMPTSDRFVLSQLTARAQLRLLGLHARVLTYYWRNHRLPVTIPDVEDPLSGEPFVYELKNGAYRLYSKGRPETGTVELVYQRPPSSALGDPLP